MSIRNENKFRKIKNKIIGKKDDTIIDDIISNLITNYVG
jgi:hypothetical protein